MGSFLKGRLGHLGPLSSASDVPDAYPAGNAEKIMIKRKMARSNKLVLARMNKLV